MHTLLSNKAILLTISKFQPVFSWKGRLEEAKTSVWRKRRLMGRERRTGKEEGIVTSEIQGEIAFIGLVLV